MNNRTTRNLPSSFTPGKDDVICGRGKKCYNHVGNIRFSERVERLLDEYRQARSKVDKSNILNKVVDEVRAASGIGGFVKQDSNGGWYEVGDFLAREKTSQAFRDALSDTYKSSSIAKKKKRMEDSKNGASIKNAYIGVELDLASRFDRLRAKQGNSSIDQVYFNRANMELLSRINRQAESHSTDGFNSLEDSLAEIATGEDPMANFNGEFFKAPPGRGGRMHTASEVITRTRFPESNAHHTRMSPPGKFFPPVEEDEELSLGDLHHSMPEMGYTDLHSSMPTLDFAGPIRQQFDSMNASMPNMRVAEFNLTNEPEAQPRNFEHTDVMRFARGIIPMASVDERHSYHGEDPTISVDLMACLEDKLVLNLDDDPFEPVPISMITEMPLLTAQASV